MATDKERLMETLNRCLPGVGGDHLWLRVEGSVNLSAMAEAIVQLGWRPPAQVIDSADALKALPDLSIVVIPNGLAVQKWHGDGVTWWIGASDSLVRMTSHRLISIWREVTLLHVPTEKAGTDDGQ